MLSHESVMKIFALSLILMVMVMPALIGLTGMIIDDWKSRKK